MLKQRPLFLFTSRQTTPFLGTTTCGSFEEIEPTTVLRPASVGDCLKINARKPMARRQDRLARPTIVSSRFRVLIRGSIAGFPAPTATEEKGSSGAACVVG